MAVVAVIGEQQDRPDDQDQRVDLEVVLKREEAGREMPGSDGGQDYVTDEKGREKGHRRKNEVGEVDDPRNQSRLLFQHQYSSRRIYCNSRRSGIRSGPVKRLRRQIFKQALVRVSDRVPTVPLGSTRSGHRPPLLAFLGLHEPVPQAG